MTPARPQDSADRAEFEAALRRMLASIVTGKGSDVEVLAIFDALAQRAADAEAALEHSRGIAGDCAENMAKSWQRVTEAESERDAVHAALNYSIQEVATIRAELAAAVAERQAGTALHTITELTEQRDALRAACLMWRGVADMAGWNGMEDCARLRNDEHRARRAKAVKPRPNSCTMR